MITFNYVEWANFLSNGATPTRINITEHSTNLIRGHNGAGKTTFMDALLYCLFNKPLRKVNLPQLVNSVNQKKMITKVNFTTRGTTYEVHRGQKPKVFKLFHEVNGVMVEMDSTNDLQKTIESEVLRTNYKTFTQVVVMASMNYTNFMSLNPADRRIVVNQMLDLETLTIMSKLLAERVKEVKGKQLTTDGKYNNISTRVDAQKRLLDEAKKSSGDTTAVFDEQVASIDKQIEEFNDKLTVMRGEYNAHLEKKPTFDSEQISKASSSIRQRISEIEGGSRVASHNKQTDMTTARFYANNNDCDRCGQVLNDAFKKSILFDLKQKCDASDAIINENLPLIEALNKELDSQNDKLNEYMAWENASNSLMGDGRSIQSNIQRLVQQKQSILNDKQKLLDKDTGKVDEYQSELESLNAEMVELIETRAENSEDMELCGLCSQMLSDNGLKAKIIKEYLPIFNNTINHYLNTMGAQYSFMLDEQFNETILSRYRDNFSYGSFSNGEASRINLSILFTFRKIASLKNTVSTNLLIMDEVLDTSMDKDGIEDLMKIIGSLDRTNIFVVSHREEIVDLFDNVVTVTKRGNFASYEGN
ncbi:RecF/RecN/SMC N terminal domain protein [Vibrio phage 3.058.O._10N.286.46.B8]|nr:RecF/RecN/SMC N terminal domain protein [Vibrio phage 2.058.O._10N.286.46.B8]AUS03184.1 RecF/RecN/SMC N terminal domain protein [Vibrio phage 3.058.O._10N.286.46.B8]